MFLSLKNIPKVSWSSDKPLNLRPKISTFLFLCFGLTLFGLGEGLLVVSHTGASPWTVLAEGISSNVDFSEKPSTYQQISLTTSQTSYYPLDRRRCMGRSALL